MAKSSSPVSLQDRILDATEAVLRRHGPEKTNVVDVAKAIGMSHGNVYRVFASKKALLDAVAMRWLNATTQPLAAIAADESKSAAERLEQWFNTLRTIKRRKVNDDPELFRAYHQHVMTMRQVTDGHVDKLICQLQQIITAGVASGEFATSHSPAAAARAFLSATARFHHPALLTLGPPPTTLEAKTVLALLLAGLRGG